MLLLGAPPSLGGFFHSLRFYVEHCHLCAESGQMRMPPLFVIAEGECCATPRVPEGVAPRGALPGSGTGARGRFLQKVITNSKYTVYIPRLFNCLVGPFTLYKVMNAHPKRKKEKCLSHSNLKIPIKQVHSCDPRFSKARNLQQHYSPLGDSFHP